LPEGPLILIANEFIDALPVRQFVRKGGVWRERCVAIDRNGKFVFAPGEAAEDGTLREAALAVDAPDGAIFETRPAVSPPLAALAARAAIAPVTALFIDYGHAQTR